MRRGVLIVILFRGGGGFAEIAFPRTTCDLVVGGRRGSLLSVQDFDWSEEGAGEGAPSEPMVAPCGTAMKEG